MMVTDPTLQTIEMSSRVTVINFTQCPACGSLSHQNMSTKQKLTVSVKLQQFHSQTTISTYARTRFLWSISCCVWPSDSDKNLAQGPEFFANINKNDATSGHFQLFSARTATSTLILRMQYDLLLLALRLTQIQARHTIPKTFCRFFFPFFFLFFPKHILIETKLKRRRKCNSRRPVKKPTMRPSESTKFGNRIVLSH